MFSLLRRARFSTPDTLRKEELPLARENRNADRKQRIRDAFQEGQTVEKMPAREDMAPQQPEDVNTGWLPIAALQS